MKQPDPKKDNPWRAVALTSAIGIDLAVCVGAGYWIGELFSGFMGGGQMWVLGGVMLGFAAAVASIYLLIKFTGGL
ncbi:AtpZ/AtpI family protein [Paenibacillus sp. S-38]|uniref:AtpZ/AtpI family protein n=1 Tax=Paenibacillus sp. S-38 TaxID=3416710 RepID=UPI003CE6B2D9